MSLHFACSFSRFSRLLFLSLTVKVHVQTPTLKRISLTNHTTVWPIQVSPISPLLSVRASFSRITPSHVHKPQSPSLCLCLPTLFPSQIKSRFCSSRSCCPACHLLALAPPLPPPAFQIPAAEFPSVSNSSSALPCRHRSSPCSSPESCAIRTLPPKSMHISPPPNRSSSMSAQLILSLSDLPHILSWSSPHLSPVGSSIASPVPPLVMSPPPPSCLPESLPNLPSQPSFPHCFFLALSSHSPKSLLPRFACCSWRDPQHLSLPRLPC